MIPQSVIFICEQAKDRAAGVQGFAGIFHPFRGIYEYE